MTAGTLEASYLACERVARRRARNFYYGFLLLPRPKRSALCALYAFMRHVDDVADTPGELSSRRQALERLREQCSRLPAAVPGDQAFWPALADTLEHYRVPTGYLLDVIDGAASDLGDVRYETFAQLRQYCYRVAGAVGCACVYVFGFRDVAAIERAEQLGIAFQLTNILRDLRRDLQMGRVYLPAEDFVRFGCTPDELARTSPPEGPLRSLLQFEGQRAWEFFARGWQLLPLVEADSRPALWALARIYSGLLAEMERRNYDVFSRPVRLTTAEKFGVLMRASLGPAGGYAFDQRNRDWWGVSRAVFRARPR
jgi:phytoene synthase